MLLYPFLEENLEMVGPSFVLVGGVKFGMIDPVESENPYNKIGVVLVLLVGEPHALGKLVEILVSRILGDILPFPVQQLAGLGPWRRLDRACLLLQFQLPRAPWFLKKD